MGEKQTSKADCIFQCIYTNEYNTHIEQVIESFCPLGEIKGFIIITVFKLTKQNRLNLLSKLHTSLAHQT